VNWSDEGFVLNARRHGESAVIVSLFTAHHGRHAGLVRGGAGRRQRGVYQPGNYLKADWRARLEEHLGSYRCELLRPHGAQLLDDPARLACLSAASAVAEMSLPEREPQAALFAVYTRLVEGLAGGAGLADYVRWELALLGELGFGLDLSQCAATGRNDQLVFVSPKTGRAVSASAGQPYAGKLLELPAFLLGEGNGENGNEQILAGLKLTGYFLERHVFAQAGKGQPAARTRLVDRVRQLATISGVETVIGG
jgi:DNA repair protein RecO (recombination protein O)